MNPEVIDKQYVKRMLTIHRNEVTRLSAINFSCNGCERFKASTKFCLHHDAVVPDEHIGTGCDDWRHDEIPF